MKKYIFIFTLLFFLILSQCGVVEKLANKNPIIKSVTATPAQIGTQDTTTLKVVAEDPDDDLLSYRWNNNSKGELLSTTEQEVQWIAPNYSGKFYIEIKVTDENGGKTTGNVCITVKGDESPIVTITEPMENQIIPGIGNVAIEAEVTFKWSIERVDFILNYDSLLNSDFVKPYRYENWNVVNLAGKNVIIAKAYEMGNLYNFGEDSVHLFIEGVVPVPE